MVEGGGSYSRGDVKTRRYVRSTVGVVDLLFRSYIFLSCATTVGTLEHSHGPVTGGVDPDFKVQSTSYTVSCGLVDEGSGSILSLDRPPTPGPEESHQCMLSYLRSPTSSRPFSVVSGHLSSSGADRISLGAVVEVVVVGVQKVSDHKSGEEPCGHP